MTSRGWEIICLAPADSGHYNFRKKDNSLLSRIRLTVEGDVGNWIGPACEVLDCCVSDQMFLYNLLFITHRELKRL